MKPNEIKQKAAEVIDWGRLHTDYDSPEYRRQLEAVTKVNERATELFNYYWSLTPEQRTKSGIRYDSIPSPNGGYSINMKRVRSLEFTLDAPELDEFDVPEGQQATKTILVSLFDPIGYAIHRPTSAPSCSVLTTLGARKWTAWGKGKWPLQGLQFLERPDGLVRDDQPGLDRERREDTLKAARLRELTTPSEVIVEGVHCALDLLEDLITSSAQVSTAV